MWQLRLGIAFVVCVTLTNPVNGQHDPLTDLNGDALPNGAIARLGTLRFRIGGVAEAIRFFDDGRKLLVLASDSGKNYTEGTMQVFDAQTGQPIARLSLESERGTLEDFKTASFPKWSVSPDGNLLARADQFNSKGTTKLELRELATGKSVFKIEENGIGFRYPLFSPDGKYIAAIVGVGRQGEKFSKAEIPATAPAEIRLWDIKAQKVSHTLAARPMDAFQPHWFCFSPDGAILAASGRGNDGIGVIWIWHISGKFAPWKLIGPTNVAESATPFAFSPDSRTVAAIHDGKIGLWDAATGKHDKQIAEFSEHCAAIAFSPDGKRLIGSKADDINGRGPKRIQMWDVITGKEFDLSVQQPAGFLFSSDSKTLILADSSDQRIIISDGASGIVRHVIKVDMLPWDLTHRFFKNSQGLGWPFALSPDGKTLVLADKPGQVRRFDIVTGKETLPSGFAGGLVDALTFSSDGKKLFAAGSTFAVVHDVDGKTPLMHLQLDGFTTNEKAPNQDLQRVAYRWPFSACMTVSKDGNWLAVGWKNGIIATWDTRSGKLRWQVQASKYPIHALVFQSDNEAIISSAIDGEVVWWSAQTGRPRRKLEKVGLPETNYFPALPFAFAPGARTMFGPSATENDLEEWELSTGMLRRKLAIEPKLASVSPDGRLLMIIGENAYHSVDSFSGAPQRSFGWVEYPQPQSNPSGWCRFSQNGDLIAGIVNEGIVRIWNSHNATVLAEYRVQNGGLRTLAFSPNGEVLATACADGTILLWRIPALTLASSITKRLEGKQMLDLWEDLLNGDLTSAKRALHRLALSDGIEGMLREKVAGQLAAGDLREQRVIELLERIGTQEAKVLLEGFTNGQPNSLTTRFAQAALDSSKEVPSANPIKKVTKDSDGNALPSGTTTRLGLLRFQHGADVKAVRYSPNGESLLAFSYNRESLEEIETRFAIWDRATGKLQNEMAIIREPLFRMGKLYDAIPSWQVSPDGRLLATSYLGGIQLVVKEILTAKVLLKVDEGITDIKMLQFSPDGNAIIAIGWKTARIWDFATGRSWEFIPVKDDNFAPYDARFLPNGMSVLLYGNDSNGDAELRCWSFASQQSAERFPVQPLTKIEKHSFQRDPFATLAISPDSTHIAMLSLGNGDKIPHVVLVHVDTGKIGRKLGEYTAAAELLLFTPDGRQLAVVGEEKMRRWDVKTGIELPPIQIGHATELRFAPDGTKVGIVSESSVDVYDTVSALKLREFPLLSKLSIWEQTHDFHGAGGTFAFTHDSKTVAIADGRTIRQFEFATGKEIGPTPLVETIHSIGIARNARLVAACASGRVQVWDPTSSKVIMELVPWLEADKKPIAFTAIALSPDGRRLVVGGSDGKAMLFDTQSARLINELKSHEVMITSLVFLADGKTLVSSDKTAGVAYWDAFSGALLKRLPLTQGSADKGPREKWAKSWQELYESGSFYWPRALGTVVSPDGRFLVVPTIGSAGLFELADSKPKELNLPRPHQGKTAISMDGRLLVVGPNWDESYYINRDSALHMIDVQSAVELRIVANFPRIRDFSLTHDGNLIAACGPDGICIWDAATGTHQARFNGHRGVVTTVAFSPDGEILVSAGYDGTLLLWDLETLMRRPLPK